MKTKKMIKDRITCLSKDILTGSHYTPKVIKNAIKKFLKEKPTPENDNIKL